MQDGHDDGDRDEPMPLADAGDGVSAKSSGEGSGTDDESGSDSESSVAPTESDESDVSTCTLGPKNPKPADMLHRCPAPPHWTPPDNQLGLPSSDVESSGEVSEPEPEEGKAEAAAPLDKLKAFWKKFSVPWPNPKKDDEDSDPELTSESSVVSSDSDMDSDSGSHLSSSTLRLSQCGKKPSVESPSSADAESSDSGSDASESDTPVDLEDFEHAMKAECNKGKKAALKTTSTMSTLETPKCSKPEL